MRLSKNKTTLFVEFKKRVGDDPSRCLDLLKQILELSNEFRNQLLLNKEIINTENPKTERLKNNLVGFCKKDNESRKNLTKIVDEIIFALLTGKIENINFIINKINFKITYVSDLEQILEHIELKRKIVN